VTGQSSSGPLAGIQIIELAGLGPVPFAGMVLSDLGADVIRIERPGGSKDTPSSRPERDPLLRGRRSLVLDLKSPGGIDVLLRLVDGADGLMEGLRPGVAERLGIGPEDCLARSPAMVYARMTGWGQDGPLAHAAGHDINYIALTGALGVIGRAGTPPVAPPSLVGDFGGGGMLLVVGMLAALLESRASGQGQVVDAAMVDGSALLTTLLYGLRANGVWRDERGVNFADSGAPFYEVYETADGRYVTVGALEPQFYAELRSLAGLVGPEWDDQADDAAWPELKIKLAAVFRQRTRDQWCALLEGTDACFAPVLTLEEAPVHPHNVARGTFIDLDNVVQPAPAPRFSRTPAAVDHPPRVPGTDTSEVLLGAGFKDEEIAELLAAGVVWEPKHDN